MNAEPLILVAGGTTESRAVAEALIVEGYRVLYSQATAAPFLLRQDPRLQRRSGRLTVEGWATLIGETRAAAIVDAGHPHAAQLRHALRAASARTGSTLLRFGRVKACVGESAVKVATHDVAADVACSLGSHILVTVGTRHLLRYVTAARLARVVLFARVLDAPESRSIVRALGCGADQIIYGRGPFTLDQNLELLRRTKADVLVTKDSGKEGGLLEKLEAARQLNARAIVVGRPEEPSDTLWSLPELLDRLRRLVVPPNASDVDPRFPLAGLGH